ncbi:MAG TPA: helix-turn-helix domain-containing protein, partial [Solirubrobacteraceae bacterium]|nr:helix-turn-helix domain-containing protein [Solirubrobacteraceae bacterium]
MIRPELVAQIRRLFAVEGWRYNTIARHLGVHHSTVRRALARRHSEAASPAPAAASPTLDTRMGEWAEAYRSSAGALAAFV